jgi:phosphate transport system protein
MGKMVQAMIKDVLDAYSTRNGSLAAAVIQKDQDVDRVYTSLYGEFMELMASDPRQISLCTHLVFIAKNVERIGDHATNVAEKVLYMLDGTLPDGERPKDDRSSAILVNGN